MMTNLRFIDAPASVLATLVRLEMRSLDPGAERPHPGKWFYQRERAPIAFVANGTMMLSRVGGRAPRGAITRLLTQQAIHQRGLPTFRAAD